MSRSGGGKEISNSDIAGNSQVSLVAGGGADVGPRVPGCGAALRLGRWVSLVNYEVLSVTPLMAVLT